MAIITKIEEQKNKKRVNLFIDDAFFCGLTKETAVKFGLKSGKIIDIKQLEEAAFASEVNMAFDKAVDYLKTRMHSKRELVEKLLKKGYKKDVALAAIQKLEEYHYVDDELFAKQFVEQNKRYSKKMLENKLKAKGIASEVIKLAAIDNITDQHEYEMCRKAAEKYIRGKDVSKEGFSQKLMASLARKGYGFEVIKKVAKGVLSSQDVDSYCDFD